MDLTFFQICIITVVYIITTTVCTACGGGSSFLMQPFMIFTGIPPKQTVITDMTADITANFTISWKFAKEKKVLWKIGFILFVSGIVGGAFGSYILHIINPTWLMNVLVCIVCAFALFNCYKTFVRKKAATLIEQYQWKHFLLIAPFVGLLLGMYNNILSLGEAKHRNAFIDFCFGTQLLAGMGNGASYISDSTNYRALLWLRLRDSVFSSDGFALDWWCYWEDTQGQK